MAGLFQKLLPTIRSGRLPPDVSASIENISVNVRHGGDPESGSPGRVIVFGLSGAPFVFSYQGCKRRIENAWPDLNDKQITRAVNWVSAEVSRRVNQPKATTRRTGWIWNW